MSEEKKNERIAIVGGGISGLFCAHILAREGKSVDLFEASERLGGRIRTIRLDRNNEPIENRAWKTEDLEFYAEFGPMRVELDKQLLLKALLDYLGIKAKEDPKHDNKAFLVDFPSYSSPTSEHDPQYRLRPEEEGKTPLQLLEIALLRIVLHLEISKDSAFSRKQSKLKKKVMLAAATSEPTRRIFVEWTKELRHKHYWAIQTEGKINKLELYAMGFWNLLSDHLSHNAILKMQDLGSFYHLLPENPNAAEWVVWWLRGFSITEHLQGISGGMESIVDRLKNKLEDQERDTKKTLNIYPKAAVSELRSVAGEKGLRLGFDEEFLKTDKGKKYDKERIYDRVILALPRKAFEKIASHSKNILPGDTRDLLQSAFGFPMVKVFAVIKNRWWEGENLSNRFATWIPTRELHYWRGRTKGSRQGLIMAYADRPASSFWSNYVKPGPQLDVDKYTTPLAESESEEPPFWTRLKNKLVQCINKIKEDDSSPISTKDITWCGIRDWGREPYYGANHAWRPERKFWVVMGRLADLELPKANGAHVHVCGEAYSDYHGFIEGSLRSAVYALHCILDDAKSDKIFQDSWLIKMSKAEAESEHLSVDDNYLRELKAWIRDLDEAKEDKTFIYDWD